MPEGVDFGKKKLKFSELSEKKKDFEVKSVLKFPDVSEKKKDLKIKNVLKFSREAEEKKDFEKKDPLKFSSDTVFEEGVLQRNIAEGLVLKSQTWNHATNTDGYSVNVGSYLNITDGRSTTALNFWNAAGSGAMTSTLTFDLGRALKIHATTLYATFAHDGAGGAGFHDLTISYSKDDVTYTQMATVNVTNNGGTGGKDESRTLTGVDKIYRYLKIEVAVTKDAAAAYCKLWKLRLVV